MASIVPPLDGVTDQVTAVLLLLVTVAVNAAVWGGQVEPAGALANTVAPCGLTLTAVGGVLLLPQAIRNPAKTNATQSPATIEYFERLRPAKPSMTTPASGRVIGSRGRRLSARRRCCFLALSPFGPLVLMVRVTVCGEDAP